MPTVLIGSAPIRNRPGPFRERLHAAGLETLDPGESPLTEEVLAEVLPSCEAMIAGGEPVSAAAIARADRLRVIARTGVGFDAIDVAAATARGVAVTITPGTNHESVAEHAFALMLAVSRRVAENDRILRLGGWDRTIVQPLRGKTLGLVGLGRIGRAMVPRALAFGMRVLANDAIVEGVGDVVQGSEFRPLDALLAESDVVSLHAPLIPETRDLIDARRLALMKPAALLINTARGGLVVEEALFEALVSGRLGGAGLDVFREEPTAAGHPLLGLPNVVASPHIAGVDRLAMDQMAEMAARCIVDLYRGEWPAGCVVNDELRPGWAWQC